MRHVGRSRLAVLFVAMTVLLLAFSYTWLHLSSASDGARLGPGAPFAESPWQPDGVLGTPLEEEADGLHRNDLIVAVDGVSIEAWMNALTSPTIARPQWRLGQTVVYSVVRDGILLDVPIVLRAYPLGAVLSAAGTFPFAIVIFQFIATYVFWRRPDDLAARLLFLWASFVATAVTSLSIGLQVSDIVGGIGFWLYRVTSFGALMLGNLAALCFAQFFPRPHHLISRFRFIPWFISGFLGTAYALYLIAMRSQTSSVLVWTGLWESSLPVFIAVCLVTTVVAFVSNHSRAGYSDAVTRQQGRIIAFSFVAAGAFGFALALFPRIILGHTLIDRNIMPLFPMIFVTALAVAILRYRLFDIDFFINRTLLYSLLTALVVVLYILIVGLLSQILQSSRQFSISLLAAGMIAVIFQALRNRVQRAVNRMMYGERDNSYAVLSRLGQRLETTLAPDAVMPTIVETVSQALKLPYSAIALKADDGYIVAAAYGLPQGELLHLPLVYQGETLGQLILASRTRSEEFSPADRRLLTDLAHQAGVAVHAVRLTADLQRSRERLVTAQEEERRRLRRDLHDGLGPTLASLTFKLNAARNLLKRDLSAADTLLLDANTQTQMVIADIRRLVYDLRPPALDDLGLVSALREYLGHYDAANGLRISIEAPDSLPPLPAAVEVAAYRISLEAFNNVVRHAEAHTCRIRLAISDVLALDIVDDGCGLRANQRAGVGLTSMRERAAELGGSCTIGPAGPGGTHVSVRLPLPKG